MENVSSSKPKAKSILELLQQNSIARTELAKEYFSHGDHARVSFNGQGEVVCPQSADDRNRVL